MALSDKKIDAVTLLQWGEMKGHPLAAHRAYARAIEAEVRGQDEALIWLMLTALEHHTEQTRPIARTDDAITAALLRLKGDHIEDVRAMVQIAVEADEVLLALKRPEGYEDVHPELVAADALPSTPFDYRVAWPLGVEP